MWAAVVDWEPVIGEATEMIANMTGPQRFLAAWQAATGRPASALLHAELLRAYSEPHRTYHSVAHLDDCLAHFDAARDLAVRPAEVELALWFHDAVYDPRRSDNEQRSAALAVQELKTADAPAEVVGRVESLILATKHDGRPETDDDRLICDVDLAILGSHPEKFDQYDQAIRGEYDFVPEPQYREGRARILAGFLNRDFIYATTFFRKRYEKQARINLERAIARLHSA